MTSIEQLSNSNDHLAPSTLPLERPRSKVPSEKRNTVSLLLNPDHGFSIPRDKAQLVTAICIVLARYESADTVIVGVSRSNTAFCVSLSTLGNNTVGHLETEVSAALARLQSFDELSTASTFSGIMVGLDEFPAPWVRQDVTIRLQAEVLMADFDARAFRTDTAESFLAHVGRAIASLQDTPSAAIADVQILTDIEKTHLLKLSTGPQPAYAGTVKDLLNSALDCSGDNPAIEFDGTAWSLGQLVQRAEAISAEMSGRIKSKGARLGIALSPGPDQIAALIAALRMCAVIVPLDTTLPPSRREAIRADASLDVIIAEERWAADFEEKEVLIVERLATPANAAGVAIDFGASAPDDPLYLMFTSGSTGRPKGVLVPHRTLANLISWENQHRPTRGKRTLGRTSIAFDVGLQEVFATILFGGTLVIATDEERANVGDLHTLLAKERISRVYLPPVALNQMTSSADGNALSIDTLEHVIVAGEQLRISQAIRSFFRANRAVLINQYGPTESHVVTEDVLDDAPLRWPDLPSIGKPISGVHVYIANDAGQLSPILAPGELHIGGVAPALGYLGEINPTSRRFLRGGFSERPETIYRTGDRARWLPDGRLEFLGRGDDQVKIRGYRVELSDLEANTQRLPGVRLAAAKHWVTDTWNGLALYIVLNDYSRASLRELREGLRDRVPEYMVPPLSAMMFLKELPLTASGKVDRTKLPYPGVTEASISVIATPSDRIAAIWKRRIGFGPIGLDDDFLDLGGHSLLAIQIVSEVNDEFGIGVPLSTLLRGTTLRKFTALVETMLASKAQTTDDGCTTPAGTLAGWSSVRAPFYPTLVDLPVGRFATVSEPEARHLWMEVFVEHAYRHPSLNYSPGATVIDVGANIGVFSRYAIQETGSCRLVAIEPAMDLYNCLKHNLSGLVSNIDLLQLGCGEKDDEATFFYFPQVPAMSSFRPDPPADAALLAALLANHDGREDQGYEALQRASLGSAFESVQQTVHRRRVSTILKDLHVGSVQLLKIDVQHGEKEVLQGIDREDWQRISQVIVEVRESFGRSQSTLDTLKSAGFSVDIKTIALHRGTDIQFVFGRRV